MSTGTHNHQRYINLLLKKYVDHQISPSRDAALQRHLEDCPDCRLQRTRLLAGQRALDNMPRLKPSRSFEKELFLKLGIPGAAAPAPPRHARFSGPRLRLLAAAVPLLFVSFILVRGHLAIPEPDRFHDDSATRSVQPTASRATPLEKAVTTNLRALLREKGRPASRASGRVRMDTERTRVRRVLRIPAAPRKEHKKAETSRGKSRPTPSVDRVSKTARKDGPARGLTFRAEKRQPATRKAEDERRRHPSPAATRKKAPATKSGTRDLKKQDGDKRRTKRAPTSRPRPTANQAPDEGHRREKQKKQNDVLLRTRPSKKMEEQKPSSQRNKRLADSTGKRGGGPRPGFAQQQQQQPATAKKSQERPDMARRRTSASRKKAKHKGESARRVVRYYTVRRPRARIKLQLAPSEHSNLQPHLAELRKRLARYFPAGTRFRFQIMAPQEQKQNLREGDAQPSPTRPLSLPLLLWLLLELGVRVYLLLAIRSRRPANAALWSAGALLLGTLCLLLWALRRPEAA